MNNKKEGFFKSLFKKKQKKEEQLNFEVYYNTKKIIVNLEELLSLFKYCEENETFERITKIAKITAEEEK